MSLPHEELPELSEAEATELLMVHSARCEDDSDERMQDGLMFSLRHWNGSPNPENFRQVMACIRTLGPSWSSGQLPNATMAALWEILYMGGSFLRDPNRIEHRRKYVLAPNDYNVEEEWLDCIGWAVMTFLQFNDARAAFRLYDDHIAKRRSIGR